jgi:hypothetical protein
MRNLQNPLFYRPPLGLLLPQERSLEASLAKSYTERQGFPILVRGLRPLEETNVCTIILLLPIQEAGP